jgi:hypothetical protein
MSDSGQPRHDPPESGGENPGVDEDVGASGGEGARTEQSTPPIADDATEGETQHPAPADDVGVPPDEEIGDDNA